MSVNFSENTKFGEKAQIEVSEDATRKQSAYGARRMSRRGSVLNSSASAPPDGVLVNSDRAYSVVAETLEDFTDLHDEMRDNTEKEISLGFFGGLKTYPTAAAWSILLSSSIIMEGYDTNLLGSFFAFPQFNEDYGHRLPDGKYEVSADWQAGLMNGTDCKQPKIFSLTKFNRCASWIYDRTLHQRYHVRYDRIQEDVRFCFDPDDRRNLLAFLLERKYPHLDGRPNHLWHSLGNVSNSFCSICFRNLSW